MVAEYFIIWEGLALEGNKFLWTCGVWTAAELRNDSFCFVFVLSLSPQGSCPRMLSYKGLRNKQVCQQYLSCDPKFSIKMRLCLKTHCIFFYKLWDIHHDIRGIQCKTYLLLSNGLEMEQFLKQRVAHAACSTKTMAKMKL